MAKHDSKKEDVGKMLDASLTVTEICDALDIPRGTIPYLLAKWNLLDRQVSRTKQYSKESREAWSHTYKHLHASGKTSGESHWTHGKLKLNGKWVLEAEVEVVLRELIEQDTILAQMARECGVDSKTITNWLRRLGLQQGIRSGSRCSWYKGGYRKGRGPDWLKVREEILERDGFACKYCGLTQKEARRGDTH